MSQPAAIQPTTPRYGFVIDMHKCIGCHACTVACKQEYNTPIGVNRTWVKYVEQGAFPTVKRSFTVMRCNHCDNAPCIPICPVSALYRRKDGIVDIDPARCIGCKACMIACPYDALHIDPNHGVADKCNFCAHRIEDGLNPACVNVCPVDAIICGDLDDPKQPISRLLSKQQGTPPKPYKGTVPKLFYVGANPNTMPVNDATPASQYAHTANPAQPDSALAELGESTAIRTHDKPHLTIHWNWQVSGYVWSKAIACGLAFLIPLLQLLGIQLTANVQLLSAISAIGFLALTCILLVSDLTKPHLFWRVLCWPQWQSWLVRGAWILTALSICLGLWFVYGVFRLAPPAWLQTLLVVLGLMGAMYTAWLFAQAKARAFWQGWVVSLHMLLESIIAGSAWLAVLQLILSGSAKHTAPVAITLLLALLVNLAVWGIELGLHRRLLRSTLTNNDPHNPDSLEQNEQAELAHTWHILTKGVLGTSFWGTLMGYSATVVCIGVFLLSAFGGGLWLIAASWLALVFTLVSAHIMVRAPQLIPLS